ncbi:MAG: zinc transporter ZupT [Clostridia bacterium]|jgi:ZIP family zinc transporter|nr:zinc transporter ZupT [Clostridia bacterium]
MGNEQALIALGISMIAGMATLVGALIIFLTKGKSEKTVTFSLAFAAGVMLTVSFSDLLPEARGFLSVSQGDTLGVLYMIIFLIVGIIVASAIDYFVPHEDFDEERQDKPHQNLFRVGFISMLAIGLHNFPEGIAVFMAGFSDLALGVSVAVAITMHNIPEGIAVAMPIYFATGSKKEALKYSFYSGVAEPVGALLAFLVLRPFINDFLLGAIFAMVAGIMLYIAIEELIPSSRQYGCNRLALLGTFAGICIMPLSYIF